MDRDFSDGSLSAGQFVDRWLLSRYVLRRSLRHRSPGAESLTCLAGIAEQRLAGPVVRAGATGALCEQHGAWRARRFGAAPV